MFSTKEHFILNDKKSVTADENADYRRNVPVQVFVQPVDSVAGAV